MMAVAFVVRGYQAVWDGLHEEMPVHVDGLRGRIENWGQTGKGKDPQRLL